MLNFTKNTEIYTTGTARQKNFTEFASKKQLLNANILTKEDSEFIANIKNTFTFALHTEGRYMAITLYRANAEKKYTFLVVDLQEKAIAECDSIKHAKYEIMQIVGTENDEIEN